LLLSLTGINKMPKIDRMLQMMRERRVDRVIMESDKPFQLYSEGKMTSGTVIPGVQLLEILEEIVPPAYLPKLKNGGTFQFRHASQFGDYDCGVENFVGTLQFHLAMAKTSLAPTPVNQVARSQPGPKRELYISRGGQNVGPMAPEQAAEGVRAGKYSLQDLAIAPHMETWKPLQEVLEFFGLGNNLQSPPVDPDWDRSPSQGSAAGNLLRSFLNEDQDPAAVARVIERLQQLCTPEETILYIAVQKKPVVTFKPISVALTTKRVIIFRPKAMGLGLSFEDYAWRTVANIHISEEILGSTFSVQLTNNVRAFVDCLPKAQARKLYQFGQQMEEQMHSHRRDLMLEERRAGAGGVNVNVNNALSPIPAPTANPTPFGVTPMLPASPQAATPDAVEVLQKLKFLLDQGLISQADYDSKKAEIMSRF
jgi:hypothetical protein